MKHYPSLGNWFTQLVFHKEDTPELIARKKFYLLTNLIAIFFVSCLAVLSYWLELKNFTRYVLLLLACNLVQAVLVIVIRKWPKWFVYALFSLYVVVIFYIIIRLGGLANSAGILMAAYFFLLTAQWMQDTKLLFFIGGVFVLGVLTAGIAFPWLTPDMQLYGWKNNLFFAFNYLWIGLLIAVALYFTIVKGEEAAKRKATQLQELDVLKSKLYANIAHEFRTPLTLIRGNAEEIREDHIGEANTRAASIMQNSDKILFLVNQMLDLSKIEEGGLPVHYVQGDLVAFAGDIMDSFQGYAESRKVGLHYHPLSQQLMMDIEADKLEGALSNLLSNAIKYTPEGGDVYVTLRQPLPGAGDKQAGTSGQRVEISVRDTGIGIPEDQLDKIFIRFYRVEDKRHPYQEGTGIGLTLVNEYLKLMKGSVSVSSQPGVGSEFVMTLPITRDAEIGVVAPVKGCYVPMERAQLASEFLPGRGNGHPRLLIIEDNEELTRYLTGLLGTEYTIFTADNGTRGIEQAIELIPDLILSDVMMPGKDGYQVCKELKNDFRTNHIPIVLLTARADSESRNTGMEQGADAYLTKPFDKKELKVCLHNLFVQREKLRLKYQAGILESHPVKQIEGLDGKFLNKALELLEKNYRDDTFGIEELYQGLGISRVQLHRKLTAITGQSASNFIRSFRLQKARKLLLETDQNISEVAYMTGFTDPNYFTRAFAQEHGVTPSDLRKVFM